TKISHDVGIHVSISGRIDQSVDRAIELSCRGVFQIFTCSPRRWDASPLEDKEVAAFREKTAKNNYRVYAHMPYLPNLSSPDSAFYAKSIAVLTREIIRCDSLGVENLVLHFGSHMNTSVDSGRVRIVNACNKAISATKGKKVRLLFENSADAKSVGARFELIRDVLKEVNDEKRAGVCLDTCHAFASGYDLRSEKTVQETMENFEKTIGLENLRLIHLNDSKGALASTSDRHEDIGKGQISTIGMAALLNSPLLSNIPVVLETPRDYEGEDKENIAKVKKLIL
ncbi:MAG: deoxyribonuclease IV, partial [Nitrososphaerales archaeon]